MNGLFDRLLALLGKASDDPEILALHAEEGIAPPPLVTSLQRGLEVAVPGKGYGLTYRAKVKSASTWPPRLAERGLVAYLSQVYLGPEFAAHLPAPFAPLLGLQQARALARLEQPGPYYTTRRLLERNGCALEVAHQDTGGTQRFLRLALIEWPDDDPRVQAVSRTELSKLGKAGKLAQQQRGARERDVPRQPPPEPAPLPAALAELRQVIHAYHDEHPGSTRDDDFDIDYQPYAERKLGDITSWTQGHSEAEAEFWVFGADNRGSVIAFWLVHEAPLAEQPIVFIGSDGSGDISAVASNLADFLALMALGVGPSEAHAGTYERVGLPGAAAILERHYPLYRRRPPEDLVDEAKLEYEDVDPRIWMLSGQEPQ